MTNRLKVTVLWIIFLFGMIFHGNLALMPLFWAKSVAMSEELIAANPMAPMLWLMLMLWPIPMIIIAVTIFIEAKWYKITNFVLTLLFTLMNIWHLMGHIGESLVDHRQIVLLTFVLLSGVMLNVVSFMWLKEK